MGQGNRLKIIGIEWLKAKNATILIDVFYYNLMGGIQMRQYYVVSSTMEMDTEVGVVAALSLQEARDFVMERFQETMGEGQTLYIFSFEGSLEFDENKRVILPREGEMIGVSKLE